MVMMRTLHLSGILMFMSLAHAGAQDLAGDWSGTLNVGATQLRLVLHLTRTTAPAIAGWAGALDSVDQGANGIPIEGVALTDSQLQFSIPAIRASYAGTLQPDGSMIKGSFTQGQTFPLDFTRGAAASAAPAKSAKPSDIDGPWGGTIAGMLRVVVHVKNTEAGLTANMISLDQGGKEIPATSVTRTGSSFQAEWKQIGGKFDAKLDPSLKSMEGQWSQGGGGMPLTLTRGLKPEKADQRRPQNPVKPYPYKEEDVTFENKPAGITMAGTLTIPAGKGPFPAVFLITGSGPQDRDEALMGHRPFLVLADHLTRRGILVLRADDRGVGKSGGVFAQATSVDFAGDAEAAVHYLQTRSEVNKGKIGLIGHSEGGIIAPMVAVRNSSVAFIVLMAGTGVPGDELLVAQVRAISLASGVGTEESEKRAERQGRIMELVKKTPEAADLKEKLQAMLAGTPQEANVEALAKTFQAPWFRYFLSYDPAPMLTKVKCPVLAINGEKDAQVPPKQNLPAIRKALAAGGNRDFEVLELASLNHLFQTANTGGVDEYMMIEETIAPAALEKMSGWILAHTAKP